MVGARVPQDWQQQIQEIAAAAGRKEAEVVREALAQYLGKTDPGVKVARLHPSAMHRLQTLSYKAFRKISVNRVKSSQKQPFMGRF